MSTFIYPLTPVTVSGSGGLTDAELRASPVPVSVSSSALPSGAATEATLASILDHVALDVVDQFDTPLLDTSSINIPASSGSPLEVVASLAATTYKVISVEDIGSYIGLYTGAPASEVLKAILPLGGGEVELTMAPGTRVSLRAMENVAISVGSMAINFIG